MVNRNLIIALFTFIFTNLCNSSGNSNPMVSPSIIQGGILNSEKPLNVKYNSGLTTSLSSSSETKVSKNKYCLFASMEEQIKFYVDKRTLTETTNLKPYAKC